LRARKKKQLWDTVNNPQKVNVNILIEQNVSIVDVGLMQIIRIDIPRADRHYKPVYIGADPFKGTFRRTHEGDYHCTKDEVRGMFRDQSEVSIDKRILSNMQMDALDIGTVERYRNRFRGEKPGHVWAELPDDDFLQVLGAADTGEDGVLHPTAAGLLMFSLDWRITRKKIAR
jgi:predicted HTH transcriptional regulator